MVMMSPQTVGLITLYLVMNLLNVCLPMENQHTYEQPSPVFLLLRKFWPFINPARPISEPVTAIKYFHTSPRHNSRFLYAKKRRYPEELRIKPHISRGDFGIHTALAPTVTRAHFKNEFPFPVGVSHLFLPHEDLNRRKHIYLPRRNTYGVPGSLYHGNIKRNSMSDRMWGDTMDTAHSTKYEEIDLPENKILDKLKKYNPLSKLSRRIDLLPWNREVEPLDQSQTNPVVRKINVINLPSRKLPLQNYKPHFQKPESPFKKVLKAANENERTLLHSTDAVSGQLVNKPLLDEFHPINAPVPGQGAENTPAENFRDTLKHTNATSSKELNDVYSHLRWNSTCISLRNLCVLLFNRDNDGNYCLVSAKINITDQLNATLNHILKDFGKPCMEESSSTSNSIKTISHIHPVSSLNISPNTTPKHVKPYTNFTYIQRKSRMLKVVEDDLTTSSGQSLETTLHLRNETTYPGTYSVSFSPNNTVPSVDSRNGDFVAYDTVKPESELNIFSGIDTATVQYSVSLLPKATSTTEKTNGEVVPDVTETPKPIILSTSETVRIDTIYDSRTSPSDISEDLSTTTSDGDEVTSSDNTDDFIHSNTPRILNLRAEEHTRQGKMTEIHGPRSKSVDRSMNVFGRRFRTEDYDSDHMDSATSQNVAVFVPEFKPGSLSNFSITFRRQPIKHMSISEADETTKSASDVKPRRYFYNVREKSLRDATTENPNITEGIRVIGSTFFPNRMQKVSLHFGKKNISSTAHDSSKEDTDEGNSLQEEGDADEGEITAQEAGFTMEKLAYTLIGTCCCLSIICLLAVVAAIKCRRILIERRLRNRLFRHNLYHSASAPWQQHIYDPFLYINGRPPGSLSSKDSCNCRCVTWSLGARNLDTRPICPTRSSIYLTGRKNLPFGAASTLCYETMIHAERRKHAMRPRPPPRLHPKSEDSSNENDSLDPSSDADNSPGNEKRCTCIHPSWSVRTEAANTVYTMRPETRPKPNRKKSSGCPHYSGSRPETGTPVMNGDCPPPVRGSDYLDRTDGVVYWSSNDERLI